MDGDIDQYLYVILILVEGSKSGCSKHVILIPVEGSKSGRWQFIDLALSSW